MDRGVWLRGGGWWCTDWGLCVFGVEEGGGGDGRAAQHRCKAAVSDGQTARALFPHTLTHKHTSRQVWPRPACARTGYRLIC